MKKTNLKTGKYSITEIGLLRSKNNRNEKEWLEIANELNRSLESVRKKFKESAGHNGDIPNYIECKDCGFIMAEDWAITVKSNGKKHCVRCKTTNLNETVTDASEFKLMSLYKLEEHEDFVSYEDAEIDVYDTV